MSPRKGSEYSCTVGLNMRASPPLYRRGLFRLERCYMLIAVWNAGLASMRFT